MPDLAAFAAVEDCLRDLFSDLVAQAGDVVTAIPDDLQARIGAGRWVIRVSRLGGGDDRITDQPRVVVEVYSATIAQAKTIAEQARQRLLTRPHRTSVGVIDRARTETGPAEWPYEDQAVRRIRAIYRVSLRRRVP